jgi:acyl-coenzyme A synthetase/AMP-(fatty) acid ligase
MVHSKNPLPIIISLHLCEQLNLSLYLCHSFFLESEVKDYFKKYNIDLLVGGGNNDALDYTENVCHAKSMDEAGIHIFTTGTTGSPKLAQHSWNSISRAARHVSKRLRGKRWLMAYSVTGYAGLQVFFSASKSNGSLVFVTQKDFEQVCKYIVKNKVNIISATPTFWRMLINAWPDSLDVPQLDQVTLGGEIVTQDIIDLCDNLFSPKRLTHIYASTEAGSAIAVSDKKAGFPVDFLEDERAIKLRINQNVLEINSPGRMKGYVGSNSLPVDGEWITTGDLVEEKNGRVYFIGRNDSRINIGGSKVLPEEVESALMQFKEIKDCVAYEKKNPIVGSLLAADIILQPNSKLSVAEIKAKLGSIFPEYKIPQFYRFVDEIKISENGKKIRN